MAHRISWSYREAERLRDISKGESDGVCPYCGMPLLCDFRHALSLRHRCGAPKPEKNTSATRLMAKEGTLMFLDAHTPTNYANAMATTKKEPCSYCLGSGTLTGERAGWAVREVTDTCGFCLGSGYEVAACAVCLRGVAVATDAEGQAVCSRCLDASLFGVAS